MCCRTKSESWSGTGRKRREALCGGPGCCGQRPGQAALSGAPRSWPGRQEPGSLPSSCFLHTGFDCWRFSEMPAVLGSRNPGHRRSSAPAGPWGCGATDAGRGLETTEAEGSSRRRVARLPAEALCPDPVPQAPREVRFCPGSPGPHRRGPYGVWLLHVPRN